MDPNGHFESNGYDDEYDDEQMFEQFFSEIQYSLDFDDSPNQWFKVIKCKDWSKIVNRLSLGMCQVNDSQLKYVVQIPWKFMDSLILRNNCLTSSSGKILAQHPWKELTFLDLCKKSIKLEKNNLGSTGAKYLSKCELPKIRNLNLNHNNIGNEGFKHLSKADWPQLQTLHAVNHISIDGYLGISQNSWDKLQYLTYHQDFFNSTKGLKNYYPVFLMITSPAFHQKFQIYFKQLIPQSISRGV